MSTSNSNNTKEDIFSKMYYQTLLDGKKPTRSRVSTKNDLNYTANLNDVSQELNTFIYNKDNDSKSEPKKSNLFKKRKILKKKSNNKYCKTKSNLKDNHNNKKDIIKLKKSIKITSSKEENSNIFDINNLNENKKNLKHFKKKKENLKSIKKTNLSTNNSNNKTVSLNIITNLKLNENSKYYSNKNHDLKNNINTNEVNLDSSFINSYYNQEGDLSDENKFFSSKNINEFKNDLYENFPITTDKIQIYPTYPKNLISNEILPMKLEEKLLYNFALPKEKYLNRFIILTKNSKPIFGKIIKILSEEKFSIDIDHNRIESDNNCNLIKENSLKNNYATAFEVMIFNMENNNFILNILNSFGKSEEVNLNNIQEKYNSIQSEVIKIELYELDFYEISNIYIIEQVFLVKKKASKISFDLKQSSENLNIDYESFDNVYENLFAVVIKLIDKNCEMKTIYDDYIEDIQQYLNYSKNSNKNGYNYFGFFIYKFFSAKENLSSINLNTCVNNHDYTDYSIEKYFEIFHEEELEILDYNKITNAFQNFYKNFPNNSKIPKLFFLQNNLYNDMVTFTNIILNPNNNFSPRDKVCFNNIFFSIFINDNYLAFIKNVEFFDNKLDISDIKINEKNMNILNNNIEKQQIISEIPSEFLTNFPNYLFKYNFLENPEKFIFHEALIKTKSSENYCLILYYNKKYESLYVRFYKNGFSKWVYLNKNINKNEINFIQEDIIEEIYINKLKGAADKNNYYRKTLNYFSKNKNSNKFIFNFPNNLINSNENNLKITNDELEKNQNNNICNFTFYINQKYFIHFYAEEKRHKNFINENNLIFKKKNENSDFSIIKDLECVKCTYQITLFDYRFCRFCRKIYHSNCLPKEEMEMESENDIFGKINYFWSCKKCKVCNICDTRDQLSSYNKGNFSHLNSSLNKIENYSHKNNNKNLILKNKLNNNFFSQKLTCKKCFKAYHYECLPPLLKKIYPFFSYYNENNTYSSGLINIDSNNDYSSNLNLQGSFEFLQIFKCEKCIKCISCKKTNSDLLPGVTWSNDFQFCSDCKRRYEKKEFCPLCKRLWNSQETKMVLCKCKFWIHAECDRILTNENFRKLTEKKSQNYHCPFCRIKKKKKIFYKFIDECINFDRNGWFFFPVDTTKEVNYLKIIKNPICFSVIKTKAFEGIYLESPDDLINDIKLIFTNAMNYNFPNTKVHKEAFNLNEQCLKLYDQNISHIYQNSLEYYLFDRNVPILCSNNFRGANLNEINFNQSRDTTSFIDKIFFLLKSAGFINRDINNIYIQNSSSMNLKIDYLNYLFQNKLDIKNDYIHYYMNKKAYLKLNEINILEIFRSRFNLIKSNLVIAKINELKMKWEFLFELQEKLTALDSETEIKNCNESYFQSKIQTGFSNNDIIISNVNSFKSNFSEKYFEDIKTNTSEENMNEIKKNLIELESQSINSKTENNLIKKSSNDFKMEIIKHHELNKTLIIEDEKEILYKTNTEGIFEFEIDPYKNIREKSNQQEDNNSVIKNVTKEHKGKEKEYNDENLDYFKSNNLILNLNEEEKFIERQISDCNGLLTEDHIKNLANISNKENLETILPIQKITLCQHGKNKSLGKNNDFQHELDIYNNSNFDVAVNKKNLKLFKNITNKIEFNENNDDYEKNIAEEQDKNEDRLLNLFNYQKDNDYKITFLYMNKAKRIFEDNVTHMEFLEIMDYVIACKDDNRKKKVLQTNSNLSEKKDPKKRNSISPDSNNDNEDEENENDTETKKIEKPKKGRPSKSIKIVSQIDSNVFLEPKDIITDVNTKKVNNLETVKKSDIENNFLGKIFFSDLFM